MSSSKENKRVRKKRKKRENGTNCPMKDDRKLKLRVHLLRQVLSVSLCSPSRHPYTSPLPPVLYCPLPLAHRLCRNEPAVKAIVADSLLSRLSVFRRSTMPVRAHLEKSSRVKGLDSCYSGHL